jgi:zinc and cadmium transporter
MLLYILLATFIVSLISLVGIVVTHKKVSKYLVYFIAFAAGVLLAATFFDLMPEALESLEASGVHIEDALIYVVVGILGFFFIERFLHWHHCGNDSCSHEKDGSLVFLGDLMHNFVDGILIAGAFLLSFETGVVTTFIIAIHEIPQEIADFSLFLHHGYSKKKALIANFLSSVSAVVGGVLGYFAFASLENIIPYVVLIAAGGFLYISLSDIIPSLSNGEKNRRQIALESAILIGSVVIMYYLLGIFH